MRSAQWRHVRCFAFHSMLRAVQMASIYHRAACLRVWLRAYVDPTWLNSSLLLLLLLLPLPWHTVLCILYCTVYTC